MRLSFGSGYSNLLKDYFKQGRLPTVKKGFYGECLTNANVSLEHLETARSGNGPTILGNLVLADMTKNRVRGNKPLIEVYDEKTAEAYLEQFKGVIVDAFDGNKYISLIRKRIEKITSTH